MSNQHGQQIIVCKNCGSNKVSVISPKKKAIDIAGVGAGFVLGGIIIPVIGWIILLPLGFIIMIASLFIPLIKKTCNVQCKACDHKFLVSKNLYSKYIRKIK